MEEIENKDRGRQEIFSRAVRAGKRTYFFDVKATRSNEYYLTITESKRRFSNEQGKFLYEKHKLFLYKEDFDKFSDALKVVVDFIETENASEEDIAPQNDESVPNKISDVKFEDLDNEVNEDDEEKEESDN